MSALSILTAFMVLQGNAKPQIGLDVFLLQGTSRVAVKNGASLSGEVTFKVVVNTEDPIQAVEFYVGDDLRESDGSTPYEFKLDTLAEDDGDVKVRFKGFTTEGKNAEKFYTVKVDNGLSLGAAAHIKKGNDFLSEGKNDEAITEGRIALKIEKANADAKILLSRANFAKGIYDKAQKFAEDVLESDKNNRAAKEVIISMKVNQAFSVVAKSANDRSDVIKAISKGLSEAIVMRSEMLDADVERLSSGDKMSLEYLDAAIRARRYTLVVDALEAKIVKDYGNVELNNRLIFAYVMTSQTSKAISFLGNVKKFGKMDGYTYAMASIVSNETANDAASDELIKEAILNSPDSLGIRTAQAFIALKRDNPTALGDAAKSLAKEVNRSEAHYFMAALNNRLGRVDQGRRSFEKALKADAIDHDMYVEQGNEAISLALMKDVAEKDQQNQFEYARTMYELALKCRENSGQALSGMSIVLLMQKKVDESVSYAEAATKATPLYAGAWYTLSAAMSAKRLDARTALAKASQLDARNLQGRSMPDAKIVFRYFNTTGRTPVVSPPARG